MLREFISRRNILSDFSSKSLFHQIPVFAIHSRRPFLIFEVSLFIKYQPPGPGYHYQQNKLESFISHNIH